MRKIILMMLLSVISFGVYAENVGTSCKNYIVPWEKDRGRGGAYVNVEGNYRIEISNDTDIPQTFHIKESIINLDDNSQKVDEFDRTLEPRKVSGWGHIIYSPISVKKHGFHYFHVVLDVTGYKNYHSQSGCYVLAKKYDEGDFNKLNDDIVSNSAL